MVTIPIQPVSGNSSATQISPTVQRVQEDPSGLIQGFRDIGAVGMEILERSSQEAGAAAGAAAQAASPSQLVERSNFTASGRAFNQAAQRTRLMQLDTQADELSMQVAREARADPERALQLWNERSQGMLQNVPAQLVGEWQARLTGLRNRTVNRVIEQKFQFENEQWGVEVTKQVEQLATEISRTIASGGDATELMARRDTLRAQMATPTAEGFQLRPAVSGALNQQLTDAEFAGTLTRQFAGMNLGQQRQFLADLASGKIRPTEMSERAARGLVGELRADFQVRSLEAREAAALARAAAAEQRAAHSQDLARRRTVAEATGDSTILDGVEEEMRRLGYTPQQIAATLPGVRDSQATAEAIAESRGMGMADLSAAAQEAAARANDSNLSADGRARALLQGRAYAQRAQQLATQAREDPYSAVTSQNGVAARPYDFSTGEAALVSRQSAAAFLGMNANDIPIIPKSLQEDYKRRLSSSDPNVANQALQEIQQRFGSVAELVLPLVKPENSNIDVAARMRDPLAANQIVTNDRNFRTNRDALGAAWKPGDVRTQFDSDFPLSAVRGADREQMRNIYERAYAHFQNQGVSNAREEAKKFLTANTSELNLPVLNGTNNRVRFFGQANTQAVNDTVNDIANNISQYQIVVGEVGRPETWRSAATTRDAFRSATPQVINGNLYFFDPVSQQQMSIQVAGQLVPLSVNLQTGRVNLPARLREPDAENPAWSAAQSVTVAPQPVRPTAPRSSPRDPIPRQATPLERIDIAAQSIPSSYRDPGASQIASTTPDRLRLNAASAMLAQGGEPPSWLLDFLQDFEGLEGLRQSSLIGRRVDIRPNIISRFNEEGRTIRLRTGEPASPLQALMIITQQEAQKASRPQGTSDNSALDGNVMIAP